MSYDPEGAIKVLQGGLAPDMPHTFAQADGLVSSAKRLIVSFPRSDVLGSFFLNSRGLCFRKDGTRRRQMRSFGSPRSTAGACDLLWLA